MRNYVFFFKKNVATAFNTFQAIEVVYITNFGYGMQVTGNSVINSLYNNEFNQFEKGIHFNLGDIGAKVGTQSAPNSITGNVMGNIWICSGCNTNQRITGNYSGQFLFWYTPTNITTDTDFPDNDVTGGSFSAIHLSGQTTNYSECPIPSDPFEDDPDVPINLRIRNDNFGGVVADTNRYPEDIHNEVRYANRLMVYKLLKKYPALLNFDDSSDSSFVEFYNSNMTSNINKIDSLETLMSKRLFVEADTLLNHFTDTNTIEHNYKRVYRLYIKLQLFGDTSLSNSDWDELYAIAMLHPLTGGHAVYAARNILKLEVHDGELSSARLMLPREETTNNKLLLYPNPANQYVILNYTGTERISRVIILDITGREVLQVYNTDIIDTSVLTGGLYFVQAKVKGKWFNGTFIISR